jgi:hypothetical protein
MCVRFFGFDKLRQDTAGLLSPHFAPAFLCARCFTKQRFSEKARTSIPD